LQKYPSPSKFTVLVYGLPRDTTEQEVRAFFSRYGNVVEAKPCSGYTDVLHSFKDVSEVASEIKRNRSLVSIYSDRGEDVLELEEKLAKDMEKLRVEI
jgi:RNA recognition motif-containing protein